MAEKVFVRTCGHLASANLVTVMESGVRYIDLIPSILNSNMQRGDFNISSFSVLVT